MNEVLRSNQPRATQSSYRENIKRMFELMKNGELYFLNEDECFFKLRIQQQNNRELRIFFAGNITRFRNNQLLNVFENCLLYTSPSPRDGLLSRMPSSA